ncbi:regulator of G-protein signaling protein-like isoform X2 [Megalobrama amblycephala]|uniref:regulator of G-protein signaling protein-like isoform X2 n=1 Tax=Megalobrama amblycephala TaxID=75352 RepID=UPI0020142A8A|nr:regulator of G-protein signaling protein-like isoform X2 [Megalobrama amblycephala]
MRAQKSRKHDNQQEKSIKMEVKFLLKDEVFVDFFNTFLSLPVFGLTPLYMLKDNKWLMWPNVPFAQVNAGAFLKWLETNRMVFFKQTELYHNFILCTEILEFASSKSTDLKWTPADQWLLRKCLGSVRGIQRFRSFLKGTAEEELVLFCVRVSMLLSMKEEENDLQTLNQQTLQTAIRLSHLSEGSAILSVCHTDNMTELLSKECPLSSQQCVLAEMRRKALSRLQSYWLPQFLHCCKSWLWRVPECQPIVEKYTSFSSPPVQSPSSCEREQSKTNPTLSPAKSFCSKRSKLHLWSSHKPNAERLQSNSICLWLHPASQEDPKGSQCSNIAHHSQELHRNTDCIQPSENMKAIVHHTCVQTPACQIPCCVNIHAPPSDLHCYLQPALTAEGLAGGPFRSYLRAQDLVEKQQMLDLLEDLDFFLLLVLKAQGEDPVCAQRQTVAQRITETYLKESMPCRVRLDPDTSQQLRSLLPSSAAVPWIYTAKYEICKELQETYDSFLDAEDKALMSHLSSRSEDSAQLLFSGFETETEVHLTQTEALVLCGGCCSRLDPADLSQDSWAFVALQDLQKGGSLLHKYNIINASEEPKLMTESDIITPLVQDVPVSKATCLQVKTLKKDTIIYEKPSTKPRSFEEAITTTQYINHFKQFLQEHGAEGALLFVQEAEALRTEPKRQKAKIRAIVDKFFRREDPMDYLQCSADIITSVTQMSTVPPDVIYTIQHLVAKSLEATWFKQYQESFSTCSLDSSELSVRGPLMVDLKANAWKTLGRFIRSVSKFLAAIEKREIRAEFEEYLIQNYKRFSEPYVVRAKAQQTSDLNTDGEKFKPKIRSIFNKAVIVDFLVNDLSFYMECERFRQLADAGDVMASEGLYSETDYAMLHHKAELIINIFLQSDLSPKLLINTTEAQKDAILQRFASGKVDRTLFYLAMMDVFPSLIFCWKRFCDLRVMKQFYPKKALKNQAVRSCPAEQRPLNIRQIKTVRSNEVKDAILRFSAQHGLTLLLPQTPHNHTVSPSAR